jgi:Mce-associated membrane protein
MSTAIAVTVDDVGEVDDTREVNETRSQSDTEDQRDKSTRPPKRRGRATRLLAFWILPLIVVLLAAAAGYLKWQYSTAQSVELARIQSVQAATESTIALLSYRADSVEKDLSAARERLTGPFRDTYTSLVNDVVIPGARQQQISAAARVPAAASVSASQDHAVVLLFVDQTTTIGNKAPTDTASSVKITLSKVDSRWMISDFTPI